MRKYSVAEVADVLKRRRWLILVPLALGTAMAPVLARYAPERYRSEALIVVVPQQVPDNYVQTTVSESVADRLPAITQEILSRSRLEPIIEELGLYPAERGRWVMEDVVAKMRGDVTIAAAPRNVDSFRVSYVGDDPEKARQVTERLAGSYRSENTASRSNQANSTSDFLESQLLVVKEQLVAQEKRLEDYRKANTGQLPSQLQGNLQAIQNTNFQLQALNESTNRAQERRLNIERQLADTRALQLAQPEPVPVANPDAPVVISPARQLANAEAALALMLQRNTPDHPDVVTLQRAIEDLKVRVANEPAAPRAQATPTVRSLTPAEIMQQQRISALDAELAQVNLQISTNQTEAAGLRQTIADYQTKVDAVPTRESELVELTRDYSTLQAAYSDMLLKRENAVIAARLEHQQIGEQFRLVDQASLPQRPDNQRQRMAIVASGAMAGLVLGVLLVGILEIRDSSFRAPEEVISALSLPVLASIPVMISDGERRRLTRRARLIDLVGILVVIVAAAVLISWRLSS